MWKHLSGEVIVGIFFVIGSAVVILQRVGIIKLPLTRSKNSNPGNSKVDTLEKVQILMAQTVEQHTKRLDNGNVRFKGLEDTIGVIDKNVGILLDRTGGPR